MLTHTHPSTQTVSWVAPHPGLRALSTVAAASRKEIGGLSLGESKGVSSAPQHGNLEAITIMKRLEIVRDRNAQVSHCSGKSLVTINFVYSFVKCVSTLLPSPLCAS